jgi:Cd2+/Zn2+-exporting ATPase
MPTDKKKETLGLLKPSKKKALEYGAAASAASPRSQNYSSPRSTEGELYTALAKTTTTSRIRIANLCCSMETKLVMELLKPLKGVLDVKVSEVGRVAVVRHTEPATATLLLSTLNAAHLGATLQDVYSSHHEDAEDHNQDLCSDWASQKRLRACLGTMNRDAGPWAALFVASVGWVLSLVGHYFSWSSYLQWATVGPCLFLAFMPLTLPLLRAVQHRRVDVNVLMGVAVFGAVLLGDLPEALGVLLLVLLASRARSAALDYVARLLDSTTGRLVQVQVAHVVSFAATAATADGGQVQQKGGNEVMTDVPLTAVKVGDVVLVRAGEQAPVDGVVVHGEGVVDESALTGECMPVEKEKGNLVAGGSICQTGALEVQCMAPASQSSLRVIQDLVHDIATTHAPSQELLDRFASYYTPIALALSFSMALAPDVWALVRGEGVTERGWQGALYRGLDLLVLACPCALAMATPLPFLTTLAASAARAGVLFKSAAALEALSTVQVLALDKTGTLTEGRFQVSGRMLMKRTAKLDPEMVRLLAASVESVVAHRLSAAVVLDALGCVTDAFYSAKEGGGKGRHDGGGNGKNNKKVLAKVSKLRHLEGVGVEGVCVFEEATEPEGGYVVRVGNSALLQKEDLNDRALQAFLARYPGEAHLYVVVDGIPELALSLTDRLRPESGPMLKVLADELKIETTLLTGDSLEVAKAVQARLGPDILPTIQARMKPVDKVHWIQARQLQPPSFRVATSALRRSSVFAYLALPFQGSKASSYQVPDEPESLDDLEAAAGLFRSEEQYSHEGLFSRIFSRRDTSSSITNMPAEGQQQQPPPMKQCIVAMIGDGINDAPSLRAADVGLAMGEHGTALAVQAADVVLLSDDLSRIPQAIRMSHFVRWVVVQNLFLALGLKVFLMLLVCSGREVQLWEAVASDGLSLMAVIINGLRPLYMARKIYV